MFRLRLIVLEQCPAGRASHADRQLVVTELQQVTEGATGLQCQCAQAHREGAAHAFHRVGQCMHYTCVGQCLAAAGRGHVDDEGAMSGGSIAHRRGHVGRFVLPAKPLMTGPLAELLVLAQSGQMFIETRQRVRGLPAVPGHPDQVFVQRLVEHAAAA